MSEQLAYLARGANPVIDAIYGPSETLMFDIDKLIVDGDDAFVTYNGWTIDSRVFRNTEYFKLKEGKIKENACFFGPGISFPNNTANK